MQPYHEFVINQHADRVSGISVTDFGEHVPRTNPKFDKSFEHIMVERILKNPIGIQHDGTTKRCRDRQAQIADC